MQRNPLAFFLGSVFVPKFVMSGMISESSSLLAIAVSAADPGSDTAPTVFTFCPDLVVVSNWKCGFFTSRLVRFSSNCASDSFSLGCLSLTSFCAIFFQVIFHTSGYHVRYIRANASYVVVAYERRCR